MVEVPDLQRVVVGGGDGPRPVGRHRHGVDRVGVAFEGAEEPAGGRGPRPSASCRRSAETARVPSALTATALTESAWPSRVRSSRAGGQVPDLQRRRRRRRRRPACRRALTATALTASAWPSRVRSSLPVARSQTFSVLSSEAETARVAVGAHRHGVDRVGVALEGAEQPAGGQVPDLQRLVVGGGDGPRAVGRHRHGVDRGRRGLRGCGAARRWPGPRPSASCRRSAETARVPSAAHRHGVDPVGVAFEGAEERAGGQVPDLQRLVVGGGDGPRAVGRSPPRR